MRVERNRVKESYRRFKKNFDEHDGIYIYPGYEQDLMEILDYIKEGFVDFEPVYDCSWKSVEDEYEQI